MNDRAKKKERLKKISRESRGKADADLAEEELKALKGVKDTKLEELRPHVTDEATFDRLVAEVKESTSRNESLAQFKERVEKLGPAVLRVVKEIKGKGFI